MKSAVISCPVVVLGGMDVYTELDKKSVLSNGRHGA